MKKLLLIFSGMVLTTMLLSCSRLQAQTIADFENLPLPADTFWNGSDFSGGFASGNVFFPNVYLYDSVYGGYWATGFAYSSMSDTADGSFQNLYSVWAGEGYGASLVYGVGQNYALLKLTGVASGKVVDGFYVCNATYAAMSMKNGDAFAKKFGGPDGNDPDWFRLSITAYEGGTPKNDTVHFYLADYRFSENSQDYILKDWTWVDLTPLGNVDSLVFLLSSTDNGQFGMNTPPFFCIDNFTTADSPQNIIALESAPFSIVPNPASQRVCVTMNNKNIIKKLNLYDLAGRELISLENFSSGEYLDISHLSGGIYFLCVDGVSRKLVIR
ncbi:MAG TPA: DUF4465 domain-containing protein [Bacteroidales bacterium]|nr:DUF4465 domain-containing protein [Bacteroidales bacterium]HPS26559.1 DUF4465 domain-containing protein [Bacteroidales bacterium]